MVIRVPAITGLPIMIPGEEVIESCESLVSISDTAFMGRSPSVC